MQPKGAPRRRHGKELKAQVLAECNQPDASVAAVAQSHGLNANLVHKWRRTLAGAAQAATRATQLSDPGAGVFVPLQLPQATRPTTPDIRIEVRRGSTSMTVNWPAEAATECAAWMRELLR